MGKKRNTQRGKSVINTCILLKPESLPGTSSKLTALSAVTGGHLSCF